MKKKIYLDDVRTPIDSSWEVVRDFNQFCAKVQELGLSEIECISFDHDLGPTAMREYFNNVYKHGELDYDNIQEKTGYDCAKWLVNYYYDNLSDVNMDDEPVVIWEPRKINFPDCYVHSANVVGAYNIIGYLENFYYNEHVHEKRVPRVTIPHSIEKSK